MSNINHYNMVQKHVTAFASIGYRLSPHPSFPQPSGTTSDSQIREAKHPDHLADVISGITFLQSRYGFAGNYMLVGHSCGGTLSLQSIMWKRFLRRHLIDSFQNPEILVSVAGIYDLRILRDKNTHPAYQSFLNGAFGIDEELWDKVSPARWKDIGDHWPGGKLIMLVSSEADELIDKDHIDCMTESLMSLHERVEIIIHKGRLKQRHDEIWEGAGLAEVIVEALVLSQKA
jgi:acetyl esterase/lipase